MAREFICDRCGDRFIVRTGFTAQYGNGQDLCRRCGENYQRWAFRDTRTPEQKKRDRLRDEQLDRSYR